MIKTLQLMGIVLSLAGVNLVLFGFHKSRAEIKSILFLFSTIKDPSTSQAKLFSADVPRIRIGIFCIAALRLFCLAGMLLLAGFIIWGASAQEKYSLENYIALVIIIPMLAIGVAGCALIFYQQSKNFLLSTQSGTPDLKLDATGIWANISVLKDISQAVSRGLGKGRLFVPWGMVKSFTVEPSQGRGRYMRPSFYKLELVNNVGNIEIYRYYWVGRENEILQVVQQFLPGKVILNDNLE